MGYAAENWFNLGCFVTDANRGNGTGYYFLAKNARKTDQIVLSDDLEEQRLLYFSATELQGSPEPKQGKNHNMAGWFYYGYAPFIKTMTPDS